MAVIPKKDWISRRCFDSNELSARIVAGYWETFMWDFYIQDKDLSVTHIYICPTKVIKIPGY